MTITYTAYEIRGLSSDTKPTNVPDNSMFYETDTGTYYKKISGSWTQVAVNISTAPLTASSTTTVTNKTYDRDSNTFKHVNGFVDYLITYDQSRASGTRYIATNTRTGATMTSGATLDPVLTSVLSTIAGQTYFSTSDTPRGGTIYIDRGWHSLSNSFAGWDIPEMTAIVLDRNCFIEVVNGYSGYVFGMSGYTSGQSSPYWGSSIRGGYIREAGTPQRLWDGILMKAVSPDTSGAIYGCVIQDVQIAKAKNGIHLLMTDTNGLSYINGCTFGPNLIIADSVNMIVFDQNSMPLLSGVGFANRNEFYSVVGQSGAATTTGVKDITGGGNVFVGCKMWDVSLGGSGSVTSNITSGAKNTQIIGGIMTSQNFTDLGVDTFICDDITGLVKKASNSSSPKSKFGATWLGDLSTETNTISPLRDSSSSQITFLNYNTNGALGVYFQPNTDSQTTTVNIANRTVSERFYIQKTTTQYLFDFMRQTTGGSLRPAIFRQYDLPNTSAVESFRIDTDAIAKFAKPIDLTTNATPANPATGAARLYVKAVDANNDGIFYLIKKNGAFVEGQLL